MRLYLYAFLAVSLCATTSRADAEGLTPHIYGGVTSQTCQWPTTVGLLFAGNGLCTGTLVSPEIVVYAAHCGTDVKEIDFGEGVNGSDNPPFARVVPSQCRLYPNHDVYNGTDFAYCKLPVALNKVPVVPILMGCETAALQPGKEVVLVGFGQDDNSQTGIKRQVTTTLDAISGNKAFIGGNGKDTCFGDSGGPAYLRLEATDGISGQADSSWRVYGITSYTPNGLCGGGGFDSLIHLAVPWIESDSGVDITPCHNADGTWNPGPQCGHFPTNPDGTGGNWNNACASPAAANYSATCGAAYNPTPPQVSFAAPTDTSSLALNAPLAVQVQVSGGLANASNTLQVTYDAQPLQLQEAAAPMYTFVSVPLAVGDHVLVAQVTDNNGYGSTTTRKFTVAPAVVPPTNPNQLSSHGAGCAATGAPPRSAMLLGLGLSAAVAGGSRRKRRGLLALALGLLCLVGCGVTPPEPVHVDVPGNPTLSVAGDANQDFAPTHSPNTAVKSGGASTLTGTVGGYTFVPQSALYTYVDDGNSVRLAVLLSDQVNFCASLQANSDRANGRNLVFFINPQSLEPVSDGNFTVANPNAVPATGTYVSAVANINDAKCNNLLTLAQSQGTAGSISVHTTITDQGAVLSGSFSQVIFNSKSDTYSGTFTAPDCDLSGRSPSAPALCN